MQTPTRREMRITQAAIGAAMIAAAVFYLWPKPSAQEEWISITSTLERTDATRAECMRNHDRFGCDMILSVKP